MHGGEMRLTRFTIEGHAVLNDMNVEVREHLVIIGANDVGKTSILRLLNLLLGATVQQMYAGLTAADIRDGVEALVVTATLGDFDLADASKFPFEINADDPYELVIHLEARISDEDPEAITVQRFFPDSGNRRGLTREQLQIMGWRYLPATRASGIDAMEGRNSPIRTMIDNVNFGESLTDFEGLLEQFNDKLEASDALQNLRQEIAQHLSRSVPRGYDAQSLAIRTAADPTENPLQDVTIFLREGDALKSLAEQSDGMRQLMSLTFFDLAQASANIVAVDEPEIHLHASSQRTVATLFAESKRQRLVVTHSPYIVQRFEPRHVLVIDPDSTARQLPEKSFTAVEKERLQWWSPQLLEGLTARRILFVEGLADRIIVEAAAAKIGLNLDRLGITVFSLDGATKFIHVLNIVGRNGFKLPICGLCDADMENTWSGNLGMAPKKMEDNGFFVARKELEYEYARAFGPRACAEKLIAEGAWREQGILQSTGAADLGSLTAEQVGDFLTASSDRKVPAARALAPHLTREVLDASPALGGLMRYLESLDPAK